MPPPFWNPGTADGASAADSLYETGNDSATEPSSGTGGRQSVDSGQGSLSSTCTTSFMGTDSETNSSDAQPDPFTTPSDHGTSDKPSRPLVLICSPVGGSGQENRWFAPYGTYPGARAARL